MLNKTDNIHTMKFLLSIMLFIFITGCNDELVTKNEYHTYRIHVIEEPSLKNDFFIIPVSALKTKENAISEKEKLISAGYKADYLWIPNYKPSLGVNEYYSVYIGPFSTQYQCEIAIDNYRLSNPKSYGLRVCKGKPKLRIGGVNEVSK
jgi:hypothetical protein